MGFSSCTDTLTTLFCVQDTTVGAARGKGTHEAGGAKSCPIAIREPEGPIEPAPEILPHTGPAKKGGAVRGTMSPLATFMLEEIPVQQGRLVQPTESNTYSPPGEQPTVETRL